MKVPKLIILPRQIYLDKDSEVKVVHIWRNETKCMFLIAAEHGFFELTRSQLPSQPVSSCLIYWIKNGNITDESTWKFIKPDSGYVIEDAQVLIATRFDPLFFLIPVVLGANDGQRNWNKNQLFQEAEEFTDQLKSSNKNDCSWAQILDISSLYTLLIKRLEAICDTTTINQNGENLTLYRVNPRKLFTVIRQKMETMIKSSIIHRYLTEKNVPCTELNQLGVAWYHILEYFDPPTQSFLESLISVQYPSLSSHLAQSVPPISQIPPNLLQTSKRPAPHISDPDPVSSDPIAPSPVNHVLKRQCTAASRGVKTLQNVNRTGMAKLSSFFPAKSSS